MHRRVLPYMTSRGLQVGLKSSETKSFSPPWGEKKRQTRDKRSPAESRETERGGAQRPSFAPRAYQQRLPAIKIESAVAIHRGLLPWLGVTVSR